MNELVSEQGKTTFLNILYSSLLDVAFCSSRGLLAGTRT
jgi:hypothetical protein